jgi:hypothetical protein
MLEERVLLAQGFRIEIRLGPAQRYRLACVAACGVLVEYADDGARHRRRLRGRETGYEFRSVEQLRYDFERDVADTLPAP